MQSKYSYLSISTNFDRVAWLSCIQSGSKIAFQKTRFSTMLLTLFFLYIIQNKRNLYINNSFVTKETNQQSISYGNINTQNCISNINYADEEVPCVGAVAVMTGEITSAGGTSIWVACSSCLWSCWSFSMISLFAVMGIVFSSTGEVNCSIVDSASLLASGDTEMTGAITWSLSTVGVGSTRTWFFYEL